MQELVLKIEYFNLKYTLECGQCFRWRKIEENEYIGVMKIWVKQWSESTKMKSQF